MIIHEAAQGSVEWMRARSGIVTASELDNLVSPTFQIRKGEMVKSYLARKLAEAWLGGPLATFSTFDVEQGRILEQHALPWFEFEHHATIKRTGLILRDDKRVGCSPDALIEGQHCGLEVKCPRPETHCAYLLAGGLPKEYGPQIQGGMYVTGFAKWKFLSYRRNFPNLVIEVNADPLAQHRIHEAISLFLERFDAGWKHLLEMNGGPPKRPAMADIQPRQPETDDQGIIP